MEGLATEIMDIVAQALAKLDNILCAVFTSAIKEIADIGLMFIPGGEAVSGAAKVMQYAKSAYENGSKSKLSLENRICRTTTNCVLFSGCCRVLY